MFSKIKKTLRKVKESLPYTRGQAHTRLLKTVAVLQVANVLCQAYVAENGGKNDPS